eukprot:scaffold7390_cov420-Prasinococcus_capsulatus_cf.AAC.1
MVVSWCPEALNIVVAQLGHHRVAYNPLYDPLPGMERTGDSRAELPPICASRIPAHLSPGRDAKCNHDQWSTYCPSSAKGLRLRHRPWLIARGRQSLDRRRRHLGVRLHAEAAYPSVCYTQLPYVGSP